MMQEKVEIVSIIIMCERRKGDLISISEDILAFAKKGTLFLKTLEEDGLRCLQIYRFSDGKGKLLKMRSSILPIKERKFHQLKLHKYKEYKV